MPSSHKHVHGNICNICMYTVSYRCDAEGAGWWMASLDGRQEHTALAITDVIATLQYKAAMT